MLAPEPAHLLTTLSTRSRPARRATRPRAPACARPIALRGTPRDPRGYEARTSQAQELRAELSGDALDEAAVAERHQLIDRTRTVRARRRLEQPRSRGEPVSGKLVMHDDREGVGLADLLE